jgi:hypothetical protein
MKFRGILKMLVGENKVRINNNRIFLTENIEIILCNMNNPAHFDGIEADEILMLEDYEGMFKAIHKAKVCCLSRGEEKYGEDINSGV